MAWNPRTFRAMRNPSISFPVKGRRPTTWCLRKDDSILSESVGKNLSPIAPGRSLWFGNDTWNTSQDASQRTSLRDTNGAPRSYTIAPETLSPLHPTDPSYRIHTAFLDLTHRKQRPSENDTTHLS